MNTQNKPTPHPHAELIKAWADGAKIQMLINGEWHDRRSDKMEWLDDEQYRIKPEEPWKPKDNASFYYVSGGILLVYRDVWTGTTYDNKLLDVGNCFRSRKEAEDAAERVKAALKGELVDKEEHERVCTQNKALRVELKEAQKGLEIIATNGLHEPKKTALSDENFQLDGKPLTDGEKEMIRLHREHVENASQGWRKQWNFLTDGEAGLIRALRDVQIFHVFNWNKAVICTADFTPEIGSGGVNVSWRPIAMLASIKTSADKEKAIISALKQIQAEQEANND